jgi:hypothetical protein
LFRFGHFLQFFHFVLYLFEHVVYNSSLGLPIIDEF